MALLGGVCTFLLPWSRIIDSGWREPTFLAWTILDLAFIAVAVVADGGPSSPVMSLFFVPIVFVGASYPTWSVDNVSLLAISGYSLWPPPTTSPRAVQWWCSVASEGPP